VVKYLSKKISDYFWDNFLGTKISYHIQGEEKWTGAAIKWIKFDDDFILINWDSIFEKKDIDNLINSKNYWALVLVTETPEKYLIFKQDSNKFATEIIEKPEKYVWNLANLWVYKFSSEMLTLVKKVKLSTRWEYEITDAINLFLKNNKFELLELKWEFIDVWYPKDIKIAEKKLKEILYKKPEFWRYNIIEKFWEYYISLWIPENQIKKIIEFSQDKNDIAMIKWTWDLKRFSNIEKFEKWYNDKNRFLFCLLEKNNKIAGIWWGRPTNFPKINTIIDEKINKIVINEKENIHTSWIRIYPEFRWKWLSKIIFNSESYYRNIFQKALICIDIEKENIPSQKAYEKKWYKYFATWKNDNESTWTSTDRMIYISFPKR
jgi:dTDP-glucose pyrophosphorylase